MDTDIIIQLFNMGGEEGGVTGACWRMRGKIWEKVAKSLTSSNVIGGNYPAPFPVRSRGTGGDGGRGTGSKSAPGEGTFSGTSGWMKVGTGVKRERRSAATSLFLCGERERPNWPPFFFQGDYLARLFDISAPAPIAKRRRRYVGGGKSQALKGIFCELRWQF